MRPGLVPSSVPDLEKQYMGLRHRSGFIITSLSGWIRMIEGQRRYVHFVNSLHTGISFCSGKQCPAKSSSTTGKAQICFFASYSAMFFRTRLTNFGLVIFSLKPEVIGVCPWTESNTAEHSGIESIAPGHRLFLWSGTEDLKWFLQFPFGHFIWGIVKWN